MTRILAVIVALVAGGCVTAQRPQAKALAPEQPQYLEASASALAFDPPIDQAEAHPEFARAPRQPSAFLGFDELSTEFYVRAANNLQTDFGDFYAQQSLSVRSGTRYR